MRGENRIEEEREREVDVWEMDVRVYPPPPQPLAASELSRLGQFSYTDPPFGNKVRTCNAHFFS